MKILIKNNFFLLAPLVLFCVSCGLFLEPKLADKTVTINTPSNGTVSSQYSQTFWWDEVVGASQYNLQIVTNKFDSSATFTLDTNISYTKFSVTLKPGLYQWRVKAINTAYNSPFTTATLTIDSGASVAGQDVLLSSPSSGSYIKSSNVALVWQTLPLATGYNLQIYTTSGTFLVDTNLTAVTYSFNVPSEQTYTWQVRATNGTLFSNWSTPNTFIYDITPPDSVILISPTLGQSLVKTNTIAFKWNASAESKATYSLYLYQDDSVTVYNTVKNLQSTVDSSTNFLSYLKNKLYWRVTVKDAAGNESTNTRKQLLNLQ